VQCFGRTILNHVLPLERRTLPNRAAGKEATVKIWSDRRKNCALAAAVSSCAFAALVLAAPHEGAAVNG
jgi:hypothetical protein